MSSTPSPLGDIVPEAERSGRVGEGLCLDLTPVPSPSGEGCLLTGVRDGEPAAQRVRENLADGEKGKCHIYMSIINLEEVLYNLERNYGLGRAQDALAVIQSLSMEVLPADDQAVLDAAHIKANHPVSYADAFVIELAKVEWLKRRK
ncbi:MAG: hypothetical protein DPW18_01845 [Chloroflexi bacterium]|nr:hypothetical protein [Chloroflexota bacterium]MDL1944490.1 type II toxin-antitoxin system VapC family toxin [Chloroflexi bacterium CFX2]